MAGMAGVGGSEMKWVRVARRCQESRLDGDRKCDRKGLGKGWERGEDVNLATM